MLNGHVSFQSVRSQRRVITVRVVAEESMSRLVKGNMFFRYTVCPGSSDPFYIVSYYIQWVTTAWTHSILHLDFPFLLNSIQTTIIHPHPLPPET